MIGVGHESLHYCYRGLVTFAAASQKHRLTGLFQSQDDTVDHSSVIAPTPESLLSSASGQVGTGFRGGGVLVPEAHLQVYQS